VKPFPHYYNAVVSAAVDGDVGTNTSGVDALPVASPPEFGGPGGRWSPETLLTAAVADCFVLTFRSIAQASHVAWTEIRCTVVGTLDLVERRPQFTRFEIQARLTVGGDGDAALAQRALEKAHKLCLVSNSLKATVELRAEISAEREMTAA
jgi:organic hydroperoxide reductase OsmC/OhrA